MQFSRIFAASGLAALVSAVALPGPAPTAHLAIDAAHVREARLKRKFGPEKRQVGTSTTTTIKTVLASTPTATTPGTSTTTTIETVWASNPTATSIAIPTSVSFYSVPVSSCTMIPLYPVKWERDDGVITGSPDLDDDRIDDDLERPQEIICAAYIPSVPKATDAATAAEQQAALVNPFASDATPTEAVVPYIPGYTNGATKTFGLTLTMVGAAALTAILLL